MVSGDDVDGLGAIMRGILNINPSSTKWLEKDDRVVADYFCDLGFRSLKQILDMRVFDLMNM